jgi:hypothetical protein
VASGMAAVFGAVTFALKQQYKARGEDRPRIAYPYELYSQSTALFTEDFRSYGSKTEKYDSGDEADIEHLFAPGVAPTVIFAETVANSANTPVLNVHRLLSRLREFDGPKPLVVLDNTLPLSTGIDFEELLEPDDPAIVLESLTKGAMHNSGHLGVVYSPNEELIDAFRKHKARIGAVTSTGIDRHILETVRSSAPSYRARNLALFASTAAIHSALEEAQAEAGEILGEADAGFNITGPTLPKHDNYAYAADNLPDGGSPVAWISDTSLDEVKSKRRFEGIVGHPRIQEQMAEGQVFLGQSFGFDTARLLHDPKAPLQIRIAGGYAINSAAFADALREAVRDVYVGDN